jgi:hypothetical protein
MTSENLPMKYVQLKYYPMKPLCLYIGIFFILSSCTTIPGKTTDFSQLYQEKTQSIVVLPPANTSTAAEAALYYSTTIAKPLSNRGYYVLPIEITQAMLHEAGIIDGAQLKDLDVAHLRKLFGADAALYVTIHEWNKSYAIIAGSLTVDLAFNLTSLKTGTSLWQHRKRVTVDTSGDQNAGWVGALIATAIRTAMADYVPIAEQVNTEALHELPVGPYHSQYLQPIAR